MALKPPPLSTVLEQVNSLVGGSGLKEEVDRGFRNLAQGALSRLDMVSREEFDTQAAILERTRAKVGALEAELESLTQELAALEKGN
ncbi:MAG: accessory factor UbiK family protein [Parahaliea sp.]